VERPLVQILVGVAIIQVESLKTEGEKGSLAISLSQRLVGLKAWPLRARVEKEDG